MDAKQIADRAQFRRYAEAALSGILSTGLDCPNVAGTAYGVATAMMLAECSAFEQYQLYALREITLNERARHEQGS